MTANPQIEEQFAITAARFNTLSNDCRLSFLEVKLYRKYFVEVNPKTPERLSRLNLIVDTLDQHRQNTIAVLKAIHEREAIVDALHQQIDRINSAPNRNANILDFQSDGLHLIYLHQQVTLRVVEAIEAWRKPLTRPFPFTHQAENYFAKILADCADVSASSLGKILPVKLVQYPLCSDLPSLCLFVTANPAASNASARGGGGKHGTHHGGPHGAGPGGAGSTRMTSEMAAKIHSAQAILLEELETQKRLLRELEGLSSAGFFLPVINLASIIPSAASGIRMSNHEWEDQLRDAIAEAREDLEAAEDRVQHPAATSSSPPGAARGGSPHHPQHQHQQQQGTRRSYEMSSDSMSDSDTDSSPATSPRGAPAPAPPAATSTGEKQRQVQIDEKPKAPPQPAPPPRPTSAKKRSETPVQESAPAAAADQPSQQPADAAEAAPEQAPALAPAPAPKDDYGDDDFEKEEEEL